MPANVTPQYEKAEQRYREAVGDEEKLEALQEMLSTIPKHKGTEKMQADIKRRISQLRKSKGKKAAKAGIDPFHVPRSGAGQAVLIGPPNAGKSRLVAATTNAAVHVAEYPFATVAPVPGMWQHEDVQIQLVDTPPILPDHFVGGLLGTIRQADVICVVVDAAGDPLEQAEMVLGQLASRGLTLRTAAAPQLPAGQGAERCGLILANKIDLGSSQTVQVLRELYAGRLEVHPVSAATGEGLEALRQRLWELLGVIRVYTKEPGKPPDYEKPFTLPAGSTVEELARQIHRELPEKMKYARIWGQARYEGQHVHRTEPLRDRDVVEIHQ